MRRSTRKGDLKGDSRVLLESENREMQDGLMASEDEFVSSSWMPRFKFVQSSHYAAETSVNGETELVHWIVKDRPFSIRVVELPTAPVESHTENPAEETEFLWNDVEVRAEVVYKTSKSPVKTSTGQVPLAVDSSVVPPHAYNHRRNAAHISADSDVPLHNAVSKLKEGAGIDLNARLSILSSHLRNDFCIHVQLFLQGHRVASWYSPTIKTVSKWDKVRLLQESSYIPSSSSYAATRTKAAPRHVVTSNSHPRSASSMETLATQTSSAVSSVSGPQRPSPRPLVASAMSSTRASRRIQATQMPVSSTMPKVQSEDSETHPAIATSDNVLGLSVPQQHVYQEPIYERSASASSSSTAKASASRNNAHNNKKKGSGEEVFDMLAQLRRVASDLTQLTANNATVLNKKRKAHWEPAVDAYPTEAEAAHLASAHLHRSSSSASSSFASSSSTTPRTSSANNKKAKFREVASASATASSAVPQGPASVRFEAYARQFLHMLDTMPLGEVREALKSLLLSRPDLASSLSLLMNSNTNKAVEPVYAAAAPSSSYCGQAESSTMNLKATSEPSSCDLQCCGHAQVATHSHQLHHAEAIVEVPQLPEVHASSGWNEPSLTSSFGISNGSHLLGQSTQFWPSTDRYGMEVYGVLGDSSLRMEEDVPQVAYDSVLPFSPSTVSFDDESTTMGSPNSYSSGWADNEWHTEPYSASADEEDSHFEQDSLPHSFFPVLTASALIALP